MHLAPGRLFYFLAIALLAAATSCGSQNDESVQVSQLEKTIAALSESLEESATASATDLKDSDSTSSTDIDDTPPAHTETPIPATTTLLFK